MAAVGAFPGVPALLTGFSASLSISTPLLSLDAFVEFSPVPSPQWGIFLGGAAVVAADTVLSLDYKQEWVIADYPLEGGAFQTYDKVQTPYDARVRFVAGGSESNRQALLNSIAAIAGDYNLYDVVTPTAVYASCNVRHYDYHRSADRGRGMIAVDVFLSEVRVTVNAGGALASNTASPSGADAQSGGSVQPTQATSAEQLVAQDTPGSNTYNWMNPTPTPSSLP